MKKLSILIAGLLLALAPVQAGEGMWLPMLVKRLNYVDMQKEGLHLTADEIYSINHASLKDAIVRLGRGFCTGEVISDKGLVLTNHHCGFNAIQELSTEENNYLDDGFWAKSYKEELPAGFSVSFLVRMEDVSEAINSQLNEKMTLKERKETIRTLSDSLEKLAVGETNYEADVKSFYDGNEFYLFLYNTYKDIRLVGTPPSSIGKFGGDTDNWMWPRHTGDFSMFRIYADKDNKPADYNKENIPYTPKYSLPISLKGVQEGDYAMIFGYPGSTDRYLTSEGVKYELEVRQPTYVKLRRTVLDIYEKEMAKNDKVRLQYSSKHAGISNYWKYFKGQQAGLKRLKVYDKKKTIEDKLAKWIESDPERKELYSGIFEGFTNAYQNLSEVNKARIYLIEAIFRIEAVAYSRQFSQLKKLLDSKEKDQAKIDKTINSLKEGVDEHFKNYDRNIDKQIFAAMVEAYHKDLPAEMQSEEFKKLVDKYKGDYKKMAEKYFEKSIFDEKASLMTFLDKPTAKTIDSDPIYNLMKVCYNHYLSDIRPVIANESQGMERSKRLFSKALRAMDTTKVYAADANSTMRVTYGKVKSYEPRDGVTYHFYTTAKGILEKENPNDPEFVVPKKLKQLILDADFGQYANKDGELNVCFLSNNDITGGNSGSPVINGDGELIGTAFDGNWEAMSGDIAFEPNLQRTISVDIRYTLFIIDKFAGAKRLIDEMKLIRE